MNARYLAVPLLLLSSCAHSHILSDAGDGTMERHFNRVARNERVTLETIGGARSIISAPTMKDGALHWEDSVARKPMHMQYAEISGLSLRSRSRGLNDGFLVGAGVGLAISVVAIAGAGGMCQGTTCSLSSRMPLLALAIPPILLGAIIGSRGAGERFKR